MAKWGWLGHVDIYSVLYFLSADSTSLRDHLFIEASLTAEHVETGLDYDIFSYFLAVNALEVIGQELRNFV
jgi:hypothetical protein